jgi:adenosylcobinamide-GDP ribazoletransferase
MASDVLLILILTALSGGIHVDGFTDAVEGFYAGRSREDILRIMRDTHIGSIGALALFFVLALKIAFLAALPQAVKGKFLLIMPMVGRWIIVFLAATGKYARNDGGLGEAFFTHTSLKQFFRASIFPLLVILLAFPVWGLPVLGIILALNYGFSLWIRARINGLTGDTLGALNEVTEIAVLFLGAASIRLGLLSR